MQKKPSDSIRLHEKERCDGLFLDLEVRQILKVQRIKCAESVKQPGKISSCKSESAVPSRKRVDCSK